MFVVAEYASLLLLCAIARTDIYHRQECVCTIRHFKPRGHYSIETPQLIMAANGSNFPDLSNAMAATPGLVGHPPHPDPIVVYPGLWGVRLFQQTTGPGRSSGCIGLGPHAGSGEDNNNAVGNKYPDREPGM